MASYRCFVFITIRFKLSGKDIVDDELQIYLDSFIAEAAERGIEISQENLAVVLVDEISAPSVGDFTCGYGWYSFGETGGRRVEILNNNRCCGVVGAILKKKI